MITRRDWLAAAGLTLGAGCARQKGAPSSGFALVATSGTNSVAAIDLAGFRLVKDIRLNAAPGAIVSDGSVSYVATPSNGSIHVIDPALNVRVSKRVAEEVSAIRLAPGAKQLIAISAAHRQLLVLDASSLNVERRFKLTASPAYLDVSPTGSMTAVSGEQGTVEVFDLATARSWKTQMPGETGAIRFRNDGKVLLVSNFHDRSLTCLDTQTLQTIVDLPLAMRPETLCFNSDQGQLFVSGSGMDAVAVVFPFQLQVEQTVLAGRTPGAMACSAAPAYLFVASRDSPGVCILNIVDRKAIGFVEVGQAPRFIAVTPDNQYALILNQAPGDMAVIRIPAIRTNRTRSGAWLYTMFPVGDSPVDAAFMRSL